MVIRALPLIRAKCANVQYVVAGNGCLRRYLARLASSLDLDEAVAFVGEVPDAALPDLFHATWWCR